MTDVDPAIVKLVNAQKAQRRTAALQYVEHPQLAFIVHSFNRISNLEQIFRGLRSAGPHELIVCDDGSVDGSHQRWLELLSGPNDFLIHSNDLHEIRATDRAIRFARSEIVCLVQDDDLIPAETSWLEAVLSRFAADPTLAVVGGFMGFGSIHPDPVKALPIWGAQDFRFVHHANIGPYFIRRHAYERLGGWDHSFSAPGEPGICFESEFCLRAWQNGFRVGYLFVPFKGPAGRYAMDGGTMLFSPVDRERNRLANSERIFRQYQSHAEHIDALVQEANDSLVRPGLLHDRVTGRG